jgi:leucyl-tRNA synthetase
VIDPLDVINQGYGADTLRTYELFIGPYDQKANWNTSAIGGVYRFLNRCWGLAFETKLEKADKNEVIRNRTIKKVTDDIYNNGYNTAVASMMEFVNELYKNGANKADVDALARLLKPFAPHLACEMLEKLGAKDDTWPTYDESQLEDSEFELIVQVNGKLRARVMVPTADAEDKEKLEAAAKSDEKIKQILSDHQEIKTIVITRTHLVNIVVK